MLENFVAVYSRLDKTFKTLDGRIKTLKSQLNPGLKRRVEIATLMPGLGEDLAFRMVVEYGDVIRFINRRKAARYTGLDPDVKESGETMSFGRIRKQGNKNLRRHLYLGAMSTIRLDPVYAGIYDNLRSKGRKHK